MLNGYVSYTMAVLAILFGVIGFFTGKIDSKTALESVWGGLAVFGIRRAIANS